MALFVGGAVALLGLVRPPIAVSWDTMAAVAVEEAPDQYRPQVTSNPQLDV